MDHITYRYPLQTLLLLSAVLIMTQPKCVNSTQFKYDHIEVTSIAGYHAQCSQHTGRTCCSRDNFEQLNRKISRVLGSSHLNHKCKRSLTNLLCMPCDGDIGQQVKQGVCGIYCKQLFNQCSSDYFVIDSNNQLRGCRDQDIICSKLSDIIGVKGSQSVCKLFQLESSNINCWNGEVSAILKGKIQPKQSEQNKSSRRTTTKTRQQSSGNQGEMNKNKTKKTNNKQNKEEPAQPTDWVVSAQNYLSLLGLFVLVFIGLYLKKIYKKWKRQYRNRR